PNPELGSTFLEFAQNVQRKLGMTDGRLPSGSQGTWLHDLPGGLYTNDRQPTPRNVGVTPSSQVTPARPVPVPDVVATVTEDEPRPETPPRPQGPRPQQPPRPPVTEPPQPVDPPEPPVTVDTDD